MTRDARHHRSLAIGPSTTKPRAIIAPESAVCRTSRDEVTLEFTDEIDSSRKIGSVLHVRVI